MIRSFADARSLLAHRGHRRGEAPAAARVRGVRQDWRSSGCTFAPARRAVSRSAATRLPIATRPSTPEPVAIPWSRPPSRANAGCTAIRMMPSPRYRGRHSEQRPHRSCRIAGVRFSYKRTGRARRPRPVGRRRRIGCARRPQRRGQDHLLKLINRLLLPQAGTVLVDGRDTREWDPIVLRRRTRLRPAGDRPVSAPDDRGERRAGAAPRGWPRRASPGARRRAARARRPAAGGVRATAGRASSRAGSASASASRERWPSIRRSC